jgi:hypothetical protein
MPRMVAPLEMNNIKHPSLCRSATRHYRSYGLSFCDGHSEIYKLHDARTTWPEPPGNGMLQPSNPDYVALQTVTTVRQ